MCSPKKTVPEQPDIDLEQAVVVHQGLQLRAPPWLHPLPSHEAAMEAVLPAFSALRVAALQVARWVMIEQYHDWLVR